jgi:predicted amidohydrolase YtcJ
MRSFLTCAAALAALTIARPILAQPRQASTENSQQADLIVTNAKVHTVDAKRPTASAFAVREGKFIAVGTEAEMQAFRGDGDTTREIDAQGRTVIPGLNDSHLHAVRAGRFYNLELRWDGVDSLERGLAMIREQAGRTPEGQWVRVIGGWSPYQFRERRMPMVKELNEAAPDTPMFVLFLYSQGLLNQAAVKALAINEQTKPPEGGRYEFIDGGAILHAEPNPLILYQMIAKPPQLSAEDQVNSTLQFYRELNRLGVTSAVDAGGGGHAFPTDYAGTDAVAREGEMSVRISYYLFPQTPGKEANDFRKWTTEEQEGRNLAKVLDHGFELEGAGEFLAHSIGDWENFLAARPDLDQRKAVGVNPVEDLHEVATILVKKQWPLRQHATYGESIRVIMSVFEDVQREQGRFAPRWAIDHAETVRNEELGRIKAMGGGIAIQDRMAFAGEYFVDRYGEKAAQYAPPIRKMLDMGIPVAAGTDGTRVSSYNPWLALYWLVTGKTVGGMQLFADDNKLSREEALSVYTVGSAWMSQEEKIKGRIAPGHFADFAILSNDYFAVPENEIKDIQSLLTVVDGQVVFAAEPFQDFAPPALPAVSPAWSPVAHFGGYQHRKAAPRH